VAQVIDVSFDLRDAPAATEELRLLSQGECPDLVIVNAGITRMIGREEDGEPLDAALDVLAVNLEVALATVAGVLPEMRRRGRGQIALISASKAALKAYGKALRAWLAPEGIAVNIIMPRFVDTPMTDSLTGPKPSCQVDSNLLLRSSPPQPGTAREHTPQTLVSPGMRTSPGEPLQASLPISRTDNWPQPYWTYFTTCEDYKLRS
jgi:NAD(P)-dependent dehydrogenase (short-subunit alcohol dehydrogenase family)